ncbi:hypothetical protein Ocin01_09760 [Orchesella cincta]|uniref:Uncharacterized protein n=1 Tax=Orchesella cincta TaxID=48709 RepID=A0A1D2MVV4_ORCCI|nr:hypothetical protein Ocin01_09760 [Orchesella cincta]
MLPNKLVVAMMLSVWGKHLQFAQLYLETTEVNHLAIDNLDQLNLFVDIPMNATARAEWKELRANVTNLFDLNENFTDKILEHFEPLEELLVPWLGLAHSVLKNPNLEETQLMEIYKQFLKNKHVRQLSNMEISTFQTEWDQLNLLQRLEDYHEQILVLKGVVTNSRAQKVDDSLLSRQTAKRDSIHGLLKKQVQIGQLRLETTEFGHLVDEINEKLAAITESTTTTLKTRKKILEVRYEVIELMKLHAEFDAKTKDYCQLVAAEDFLALWVHVFQTTRQNPHFDDEDLEEFAQPLLSNENVRRFMRLDVSQLLSEWKQMNLSERMHRCSDTVRDLVAGLPNEKVTESEILATLLVKQENVGELINQCNVLLRILNEIGAVFEKMSNYLEIHIKLQPISYKIMDIWKEFEVYQPKIMTTFETLGKAVKLLAKKGTDELIESGQFFSDESIQEAFKIDIETLQKDWTRMDLIERAKSCQAEVKTVKAQGDRIYQRASEL